MKMKNNLPTLFIAVDGDSESRFIDGFQLRNFLRRHDHGRHIGYRIGGNLHQSGAVQLGNNNDMYRRHGMNVFKGKNMIILINLGAGDLSFGNPAKKAIFYHAATLLILKIPY